MALISGLVSSLEEKCANFVNISIEINSLEDAFINIAMDEERLLQEQENNSQNNFSIYQIEHPINQSINSQAAALIESQENQYEYENM